MAKPDEAVEFLRHVSDVESQNRVAGLDDLKFRFGDQWPIEIQNSRNLESRPCLTINEVDSFCRQVENQQRQQRPRIKVHAVDDVADPKTAKTIQGLCRHIEVNSNADQAYDRAFMFADTIGWGYFRMRTDYIRPDSFDQDIYIDEVENPFTVYFDPSSSLPDGSDAEKALVTDLIPKKRFEADYPNASPGGFQELAAGDAQVDWVTEKEVRLAEYYYTERKDEELVKLSDGSTLWGDQAQKLLEYAASQGVPLEVVGTRPSKRTIIKWCKQTAFEILEEAVIPGRWIPIIPVYGTSFILNGRRIRQGLVRMAKDPQRMVNYWETALTEYLALAPKAKWLLAEGQDEGFENEWAQANIKANPLLHHKQVDVEGRPAPPPQRIQPDAPPNGMFQAAAMSSMNLKRVLGMYDPALTASSQHKSHETINAEDQQTDQSNFHYYDNLTRSIRHAGKIMLEWFPVVYDTQRVMRIVGDDERPDLVTINEKTVNQSEMVAQNVIKNNVTIGEYDIVMDTGPGYNSRRQEGVRIFTEMLGTPLGEKIAQVADDVIVRQMDVPGADVIADRLAAANPMSQIDDKSDIPPQAQMMIKNLQGQLEQANQIMQGMQMELKYKGNLEQMKQTEQTKRTMMTETVKAEALEKDAATRQHDTEVRAMTAHDVAEIDGLVKLLLANVDTKNLEKELAMREKETKAKAAESPSTLQ